MKKIVFVFALCICFGVLSNAQQPNHPDGSGQYPHKPKMTPEERASKLTQYMTTSLNLTNDQQTKVSALNISKAKQVDSIRTKYKGNMEAGKTDMKATKESYNKNLNSILTPDQKSKWETIKKQKREEFQKNKAAGTKPKEGDLTPEDLD